ALGPPGFVQAEKTHPAGATAEGAAAGGEIGPLTRQDQLERPAGDQSLRRTNRPRRVSRRPQGTAVKLRLQTVKNEAQSGADDFNRLQVGSGGTGGIFHKDRLETRFGPRRNGGRNRITGKARTRGIGSEADAGGRGHG